jgi:ABC-type multidrug transport system ATPase subunit
MDVDITIKNYRCFPDSKPAKIELRSGLTAFIGANNSGKSTLLKMFFELRSIFEHLSDQKNFLQALQREASFALKPPVTDVRELFHHGIDRAITIQFQLPRDQRNRGLITDAVVTVRHGTPNFRLSLPQVGEIRATDEIRLGSGASMQLQRSVQPSGQTTSHEYKIDRICEAMAILRRCIYIGAFRNAINVGTKEEYFDIDIGEAFIKRWQEYKSGGDVERARLAIRVSQDIARLFEIEHLDINPMSDGRSLQVIRDGQPFKLVELGAGIAQFVVVLANVAIKRPSFLLIDEPELNLHPSLQLDFLTSIASYASRGVLFSTHNIGLARASADQIYSVRISGEGSEVCELEATTNLPEFLGEMSFSGYRDIGFEKILLVEGPSEIKTIQQLLRLFRKDHKVVLLSLGGSSMINGHSQAELEEIKRICPKVAALIDSERESESAALSSERSSFKTQCDQSKIACHLTDRRATENYFPEAAVKRALGQSYAALATFDALRAAPNGWSKRDNWRIAREMKKEDLDKTDLGEFLENI